MGPLFVASFDDIIKTIETPIILNSTLEIRECMFWCSLPLFVVRQCRQCKLVILLFALSLKICCL